MILAKLNLRKNNPMTQLTPIQLDHDTVIYLETQTDIEVESQPVSPKEVTRELTRGDLGKVDKGLGELLTKEISFSPQQPFKNIEGTIKAYTSHTLNAFKEITDANISKVTLEFGIKIGGKAGIPYVTEGTAESNLKITVECTFPPK
jgi:hypothetical protein